MLIVFLVLILKSLAAIFAKQAALTSIDKGLYGVVFNVWLMAELMVLFFQAIAWTLVLRHYALSIAYPFMSLVFGINLFAAWLIFDEKVLPNHIFGIAIIIAGILIINPYKEL